MKLIKRNNDFKVIINYYKHYEIHLSISLLYNTSIYIDIKI